MSTNSPGPPLTKPPDLTCPTTIAHPVTPQSQATNKSINLYSPTDPSPYTVFVQRKNTESAGPATEPALSNIHPITFGKLLASKNIREVKSILKKGRNRIGVVFETHQAANSFATSEYLKSAFDIYIPTHLTTCQGIIRSVDLSLSDDDIIANIKSNQKVISIRRLNRKSSPLGQSPPTYAPTQTVVVTFAGRYLPKSVSLYYVTLEVHVYVLPVLRCYNCLRFGHTAKQCKSEVRCSNCTGTHSKTNCDTTDLLCVHCSKSHSSLDPTCPELKRQQSIKQTMATEQLTFEEASALIPRLTSSTTFHPTPTPLSTPQSYPSLVNSLNLQNVPSHPSTPRVSYSSIANITKKRKTNPPSPSHGYDKDGHNRLLLSPNGHMPQSPPSNQINIHNNPTNPITSNNFVPSSSCSFNQADFDYLKTFLKPLPQGETILNLVYSILLQAINSINQNNDKSSAMEL